MTNNTTNKGRGVRVAAPRSKRGATFEHEEGRAGLYRRAAFKAQAKETRAETRPSAKHEEGRAEARPYNGELARREEKQGAQDGDLKSPLQTSGAAVPKKVDGVEIWKQFEDLMIPRLRLTVNERAVYSYLLRHSRLEGKPRLRFSILGVAQGAGLSTWTVRKGVRRLAAKGALRLAERSKKGHVVEVHLPEEIRAVRAGKIADARTVRRPCAANLEEADFLATRALREAIHGREGGRCFYCLRRTTSATRCIDHVIPQVRTGSNCYSNLVSSCAECNAQKCEQQAEDFLRWLYREERLAASELKERLSALKRLAAGELRPAIAEQSNAKQRFNTESTERRAQRSQRRSMPLSSFLSLPAADVVGASSKP